MGKLTKTAKCDELAIRQKLGNLNMTRDGLQEFVLLASVYLRRTLDGRAF